MHGYANTYNYTFISGESDVSGDVNIFDALIIDGKIRSQKDYLSIFAYGTKYTFFRCNDNGIKASVNYDNVLSLSEFENWINDKDEVNCYTALLNFVKQYFN